MTAIFSALLLHDKIAALCPIDGVVIGDPNDKTTWRIDFDPAATAGQIAAAQSLLATLTLADITPAASMPSTQFFGKFTDAERAAIWAAATTNPAIGVGLVNGLSAGSITPSDAATKTWLAACVTAGALTQDRANAVAARA